jgi:hypothetical protein
LARRLPDRRFPRQPRPGRDRARIAELVDAGTIRIIDVAFVGKNERGDAVAMELTELDPDVQRGVEKLGIEITGLLNEQDLKAAADELEPNSSAALLVWENLWARKVAQAMRDGPPSPRQHDRRSARRAS